MIKRTLGCLALGMLIASGTLMAHHSLAGVYVMKIKSTSVALGFLLAIGTPIAASAQARGAAPAAGAPAQGGGAGRGAGGGGGAQGGGGGGRGGRGGGQQFTPAAGAKDLKSVM